MTRDLFAWLSTLVLLVTSASMGAEALAATGETPPQGGLFRFPDVSNRFIAFVYADDVWLVPREGGVATPLASPAGLEYFPRFSPDGRMIAFAGNYDGNQDIYTVPTEGGIPHRVTHHPAAEMLNDWTADGDLLFAAPYGVDGIYPDQTQLFTVAAEGGMPRRMPVPFGSNGAISADGRWLAYTPFSRDFRTWKRYLGGLASDIWLFDLHALVSKKITDWKGTDSLPMWHGENVYYLSDRGPNHRLNIWMYDGGSGEHRQLTRYSDYDVKFPSIGPGVDGGGEIVFQYATSLHLLDLRTGEAKAVPITLPGSRQTIRPRRVEVDQQIFSRSISPTGKRALVGARGDIWSIPAKDGTAVNLTRTSGVAERYPRWSPDGKWIAYQSDATGEYELYVLGTGADSEVRQLTSGSAGGYRYEPVWSPDSQWIAYKDGAGALFLYGFEEGRVTLVDKEPYYFWAMHSMDVDWSPDSRWLAYARTSDDTTFPDGSQIRVYDVQAKKRHTLTSGLYRDRNPVFDPKGDFLYYISDRAFTSPVFESGLFTSFTVYVDRDMVLAVPLRADVGYPLAPRSDEETVGAKGDEDESKQGDETAGGDSPPAVDLAIDGFEDRAIQLPIERGELSRLSVNDKGQLLYLRSRGGLRDDLPGIRLFDPSDRTKSEKTVADGVRWFMASDDGKKLLVLKQEGGPQNLFQELSGAVSGTMVIVDAAPDQKFDPALDLSGLQVIIDPREEWRQVFRETWRAFRDDFYDPGMHGVDWEGVRRQYGRMLEGAASRGDLHYILGEMVGELNAGHTYVMYQDVSVPSVSVGLLGADFELHHGAYRIRRIYRGGPWDTDARGPLGDWYVGVREGDYLLAVNGIDVDTRLSPWAAFQGLAGKTVRLTVSESPVRDDRARHVDVSAVPSDYELRYRAWIEKNRAYVEEKTGGRVGYMHVPDCMPYGLDHFTRQFFHQRRRDALIVDERWNAGGYFSTRYIEALNRQVHFYAGLRNGAMVPDPGVAHYGPKAMLINAESGSDGDLFPAKFRQRKLGKLIGTRTWGGVIGILGNPQPIDGGLIFVASISTITEDSKWTIEGHGVDPDIDVVEDPARMADGEDPQLDAAIRYILEELETNPHVVPPMPEYPDRSGLAE